MHLIVTCKFKFKHFCNFRGLQRKSGSSSGSKTGPDFETIQGILEFGLKKILWLDRVSFFTSSRTDTKVHAHESTAIFELNPAGTDILSCLSNEGLKAVYLK